ncbi:MAG: hypothetical protein KA457_01625 [Chitinophagales bacterium]|nr:hypothetical protein [Chitinophagales bacterium]MBP6153488.1 hypothetical protein [Chitinophagales bacterium]
MKAFSLIILFVLTLNVNAGQPPVQIVQASTADKLVTDRMEYLRTMKNYVGELYWKKMIGDDFPSTVVYFADTVSYFIHPFPKMKNQVSKYTVMENEYDWTIWRMHMPLDSAPYVIETQFQFNPKKEKYYINYRTPVLFISSPELMQKKDAKITSTQAWSIPVMHQLFRQFQYANEAMMVYAIRLYEEGKMYEIDSMQGIYRNHALFRDTLQLENEILKKALAASSVETEKELFTEFLRLRAKRHTLYNKEKKTWVSAAENFWEKLEGTCVRMEEKLKENFHNIPISEKLAASDTLYVKDFSITNEDNNSELKDDKYYVGTTGYNMLKLLEKNKVPYQENFFSYASLSLEMQLKYFYKIQ